MCCGNSFCQQLWGTGLRAWLLCVDTISYKEEEGLSCPCLAGRSRRKTLWLLLSPWAEWQLPPGSVFATLYFPLNPQNKEFCKFSH